jgi:hypothetical protein
LFDFRLLQQYRRKADIRRKAVQLSAAFRHPQDTAHFEAGSDAFRLLEQTWVKLVSFAELENAEMKPFLMAFAAALVSSTFALAEHPSDTGRGREDQGCLGSPWLHGRQDGKETEASGYFEVDDAKCKDGQYDIKLDKDFKLIAMTRD